MGFSRAIVLTGASLFLVCLVLTAHAAAWDRPAELIVRSYVYVSTPAGTLESARRTAETVLAGAGVTPVWVDCHVESYPSQEIKEECSAPLKSNEVIIRFMSANTEVRGKQTSLGYSMVDKQGTRPVISTIYVDRVSTLALQVEMDFATILGRAIAHEMGHLLLRSTVHSRTGLMRALWSRAELRSRDASHWQFSSEDAAALKIALLPQAKTN